MNGNPLVSIIVPSYNGERLIGRFFDSVLRQTYTNLELIFVNDGSTDGTEAVAKGYGPALEEKGIQFVYLYQENAGQAAAINFGLMHYRGEYLMFSDSDDWLSDDCVEVKLRYLQQHPEKMLVLGKAAFVEEEAPDRIVKILQRRNTESGWIFDDLVFERDGYFAPGCYLMRAQAFRDTHPDGQLYVSRGGQNWQILLPLTYRYECGYIEQIIYYIVIHQDSHSREGVSYEKQMVRSLEHEDILNNVIGTIDMPGEKRADYLRYIRVKYLKQRLHIAATCRKKDAVREYYRKLTQEGAAGWEDKADYLRGNYDMVYYVIQLARYPWRLYLRLKGE